ncbi:MAG: aminoglycoside phosphotransferase family protein [Anaerolineae bacterium]|nr:aminoglycoside phosphotransferase family protein [Anaerolineae bacterium]
MIGAEAGVELGTEKDQGYDLEPKAWLRVVADAYATGKKVWTRNGITVRRVTGGANNALYQVVLDGQQYAFKLCVADERRRAAREYGVLDLLASAGADLAPQPVLLDESCAVVPFPTVVYRWLPGKSLGPLLTIGQLRSLLESVQRIHAIRQDTFGRDSLLDAWFHWFDFEPYLNELDDFLARYGGWLAIHNEDGPVLRDRLARLVDGCAETLARTAVDPGRGCFSACLCRVDPNLANSVWDGKETLRWVDWEYSGWGDPALDLADLRWHAALDGLSETQHAWLRNNYVRPADDPGFEARLAAWDCLLSTRWPFLILRVLWSAYHGSDRVRLTRPESDPEELVVRFVRTIDRAERFAVDQQRKRFGRGGA